MKSTIVIAFAILAKFSITIPAVNAVKLSKESFKAGNVKAQTTEYELITYIFLEYYNRIGIISDPAKANELKDKNEEDKKKSEKEIDDKVNDFKTKSVDEVTALFDKLMEAGNVFIDELVKGGAKDDKSTATKKLESEEKFDKAVKDFDDKVKEAKKNYNELFNYLIKKVEKEKQKILHSLVKNSFLSRFHLLAARALVIIVYNRCDEFGYGKEHLEKIKSNVGGKVVSLVFYDSVFSADAKVFNDDVQNFLDNVRGLFIRASMNSREIDVLANEAINKTDDDVKKSKDLLKEVKDDLDEIKKEFDGVKKKLLEAYEKGEKKIDVGSEKKTLDGVIKRLHKDLPETFDGFGVKSVVLACLAVAVSAVSCL